MKLKNKLSLAVISIVLCFLFTLLAVESSPLNLIENPSFEFDDDLNGVPDCWFLIENYPNDYYLDSQEVVFGTSSLKMKTYCEPYMYAGAGGASMYRNVKPNTTYTVSYYVKTDHPANVLFHPTAWELDSNGQGIGQQYIYLPLTLTEDWQRKEFTFTTSPYTAKIYLTVILFTLYSETVKGWKEGVFYTSWIDGVQLEEAAPATPFHINFISCPQAVAGTIDIKPETLELKSEGERISCFIELPQGFDVGQIDVSTVRMSGEIYADLQPTSIGDYDADLIPDLMVKFNRQAVINYLKSIGVKAGDLVELIVKGNISSGNSFRGSDRIRIVDGY